MSLSLTREAVRPGGSDRSVQARGLLMGGFQFGLRAAGSDVDLSLPDDYDALTPPAGARVHGRVRLDAARVVSRSRRHEPAVRWAWHGEVARLAVKHSIARLTLAAHPAGAHEAEAWVAPRDGVGPVLIAIVSALVHRAGGLVLHAAALDIGGRAVLFCGPANAGKTTACNHWPGARALANDRVALLPHGGGFEVWPLPGGRPTELAPSRARGLPLAGVLRPTRGGPRVAIATAGPRDAAFLIRQSAECPSRSRADERRRLQVAWELACSVPVGRINTVLGEPIAGPLAEWLELGQVISEVPA